MTPEELAEMLVTEWMQAYPTTRWMTDGAAMGLEDRIVAAIKKYCEKTPDGNSGLK